jgi:hypothetical protein
MSYASADGLPVTYSQVTITNAESTETLLITPTEVINIAGPILNLGAGNSIELALSNGLVTSYSPVVVDNANANIVVENASQALRITPSQVIATIGNTLNLGAGNSIGVALTNTQINAYVPYVPQVTYPIAETADLQYPVGYVFSLNGVEATTTTGAVQNFATIAIPSDGVWSVTGTLTGDVVNVNVNNVFTMSVNNNAGALSFVKNYISLTQNLDGWAIQSSNVFTTNVAEAVYLVGSGTNANLQITSYAFTCVRIA